MKTCILFLFISAAFTISVTSQEVSQWRGPNRNGIYPATGLLKVWPANGPKLLWHFDGLGEGFASAVPTKGHVYSAGCVNGKGYVFCLDAEGNQVWKITYGDEWTESWNGTRSTPLFYDGKVYMMSPYGKVVCMGGERGNIIWSADLMKTYGAENIQWGMTENLLIDDNKLFCIVGGSQHNVIALDKDNGKLVWSCPGNGDKGAYNSPLLIKLAARELLVCITEHSVLGIDAESGKKLWSQQFNNQYSVHPNTPIYDNGYLYCMTGYGAGGTMYKLSADGSQATQVWKNASLDSKTGGAIMLNSKIYGFGDKNKGFHVIDWKTGKELAVDPFNQKGGNLAAADGMIYTYDESGEVALIQITGTGIKKVSSFKVPFGNDQHWAHLVIDNGKLYVRHGNSLMVYDIKGK
ncbi:MAG: PQQ-binding-like beta-propeller repeat protein [Bacteroidetes bacterium]|nr:PQQ-binding-like beta-propeller repeat protein [Bacteroidota bacterium]